jgi:hypothetical protein
MKKVLNRLSFVFIISAFVFVKNTYGQITYTNNWIDSSKIYSKITVVKKGFYSVSIQELAKTDPTLIGAKPENLNLFFRGKSIAFEVISASAVLSNADKIVFFGIPNDGKLETEMYRPASAQPHIFSSLFTKESNYYLVNDPENPLKNRVKNEIESVVATDKIIQVQNYQIQKIYDTEFSFNSTVGPIPIVQQSFFEPGEAYTGRQIRTDEQAEFTIDVKDAISGKGVVDIILNGRADLIRRIRIRVGNKDTIVTQAQFAHRAIKIPITFTGNSVKLVLSSPDDRYSLSLFKLTYDSKIVSSAENSVFVNANTTGTLKISDGNSGQPKVYNISDPYEIKNAKFLSKESTVFNYLVSTKVGTAANEYYYSQTFLNPEKIIKSLENQI